ncbi:bifunctional 4-hydroxy-2-oxoglutarate aldolase/2-dehydro-3-deoxy-phosphogluconate aldolase [Lysinibacillus sp. NPDC059133]|uniref:bifunctional 4-hydroxy-2-oxoglutarate aldolase/2-dehydro-3-deoxy-phosphogluconate aldolase n=1 Tax=Lysinibacillus sp. NPDC059133 TaxID=3346737 RepID=UPI0036BEC3D5
MKLDNLMAIIRDVSPNDIVPIVQALLDEGIKNLEVSLSNETLGIGCIENLASHFTPQQIYLGAGTVLNEEQLYSVKNAGVQYIITPGWNKELVKKALKTDLTVYPGVYTPGEIAEALELNIDYLKLFPINGLNENYLKAIRGPFPKVNIMAVGGVTPENIKFYKKLGIHHFGIGSELVPRGATQNDIPVIKSNAKLFISSIKKANEIDGKSTETND